MKDYKFSKQIKRFSIILIIIGAIGIAFGFYSAPTNIEESKELVANMSHDDYGGEYSDSGHETSSEHYDHDKHVFYQLQNKPWLQFMCQHYSL